MQHQQNATPGVVSMFYFTFFHRQHPRELCKEFWRDPHGMVAARGPGGHLYRQHHFDINQVEIWPRIDGVTQGLAEDWMPDGCDELVMDDPTLLTPEAAGMFMNDEQNFLRRGLIYAAPKGQYTWHRNEEARLTRDLKLPGHRIAVFLRHRDEVGAADFVDFIHRDLMGAVLECDAVQEAKSFLFAPYDESAWPSPGLTHHHPADLQFHGALLLGADSELAMARMFQSDAFQATMTRQSEMFEAVYSVGVECSYNMVDGGKPTLVGLHGYTCARIISRIGAVNHTEDPVQSAVLTIPAE